MQWLQEYYFLHVGTFCDASNRIFFWSIVYNDCRIIVFHMLGPSLMNQNEFSLEVTNAVIAILFSACWCIVWCIKANFLLKYCMQWLQEYYFLHVGTECDASKQIFFLSIVYSDCTRYYLTCPLNRNARSETDTVQYKNRSCAILSLSYDL